MRRFVLDSSALLAVLLCEAGADVVAPRLAECAMGVVNWAEVLSKQIVMGSEGTAAVSRTQAMVSDVVPMDIQQATEAALLTSGTHMLGLSLGDRACLALGRLLQLPVLTADRSWARLKIGVEVRLIR